ncbi:MAG: orotidine-5'-phosphate decarboxylase [Candidatus Peribacteraceae bacterium]|jgi:orotidine-5'-phosphate decarboxylase
MHFADSLTAASKAKAPICVGLDPNIAKLPKGINKDPEGVLTFCKGIIDAVKDTAACVKPQMAYFELLGWEGMKVFWEVCAYAKEQGLLVIADGKRNDIGSTCDAYAEAYLNELSPIDALTVSPYLGSDGVKPFIERCMKNDKGIFVLVKTSNPSSGDLQDLPVGDEVVHEHMAQLVEGWGQECLGPETSFSCVGAVVGATYPEELKYLRTLMPHCPILIPGYGVQGGGAADCKPGFLADGTGAIVNSSRGIIFASTGKDWQDAARKAVQAMAKDLQLVL